MGKDLHRSILDFFHDTVGSHHNVKSMEDISTSNSYIFKINRQRGMTPVIVYLSDAYYHSDIDYHKRPAELNDGGFILIAKPESHFSKEDQMNYPEEKIIIGKIGILLGALKMEDFWNYERPKKKHT
ncbi:hypothetical protein SOM12_06565 [Flavobacterium sp. CFBP9031]|uniref:hypothetical protein n=1 Tax=Flavobacterium sp. CFBP9031 TaxID=3096538 RepID=UPI002A6AB86C|nr:hypothetical protein [Flavobacterium sp. CFBP9031]MDY0987071.1 hypothetical protein [Flavobacterium sp. CFBP9031]